MFALFDLAIGDEWRVMGAAATGAGLAISSFYSSSFFFYPCCFFFR
jgi:hypothetical protein